MKKKIVYIKKPISPKYKKIVVKNIYESDEQQLIDKSIPSCTGKHSVMWYVCLGILIFTALNFIGKVNAICNNLERARVVYM